MRIRAALVTAVLGLSLTACAEDEPTADPTSTPTVSESASESESAEPTPTEDPTPTEQPGQVVQISIAGDVITPNGERIDVPVGEPLTLEITSDRPGELHVHSKPEQFVEFAAGTTTEELVFEVPGVVEIEDHDTDFVIVQLEVK